jgi:hypothetical protein
VAFRLKNAGGSPDIFTPAALDLIFRRFGGIPRIINLMCNSALVYGYADELKTIDKAVVTRIIEDKCCIGMVDPKGDKRACPAQKLKEGAEDGILQRLQAAERNIDEMKAQMAALAGKLEERTNKFRDELVLKLQKLLVAERSRNDRLLSRYAQLKLKYQTLEKKAGNAESVPKRSA